MPPNPVSERHPPAIGSAAMTRSVTVFRAAILAALLGGSMATAYADTPDKTKAAPAPAPTRYLPDRFAGAAGRYYRLIWGVDALSVKMVESGEIIRFSWRVLDADKAQLLSDKRAVPSLVDPAAGVSLVVPTMEQIGQLRQSSTPEAGKSYWMAFSNKGRIVKRGDRVNVVIGQFHADGLAVD
jgi:hypothetical protein